MQKNRSNKRRNRTPILGLVQRSSCRRARQDLLEKLLENINMLRVLDSLGVKSGTQEADRKTEKDVNLDVTLIISCKFRSYVLYICSCQILATLGLC